MTETGLNLYSLRRLIGTEDGFRDTLLALKDMGYAHVQYSGGPYEPERIARVSRETGLPIVLTHQPLQRILEEPDELMREHESFHCRHIGLGSMPGGLIADASLFRAAADALEAVCRRMRKNGFTLTYHHHNYEFIRHGNETAFDYIVNQTSLDVTVDTYWLQYGGADVLKTVDRLAGRISCLHLKDYRTNHTVTAEGKHLYVPGFAPVGDGVLDFSAIVQHAKAAGTRYFLVEQDDAQDYPDPMEQVRRSIDYIKNNSL